MQAQGLLAERLRALPDRPGVYLFKDVTGNISYIGPFTDADAVRNTLDTVNRLFPYIRCRKPITGTDRRACIYYDIHRCVAPCIGAVNNAEYRNLIDNAVGFLEGKHDEALDELRQEMEQAAEDLQFERAAALRDRIRAAERIIEQQRVVADSRVEQDVLGLARENGNVCVQVFYIRDGKLRGRHYFLLEGAADESDGGVVTSFLLQHYGAATQLPREIVLPAPVEDTPSM